MNTPIHRRNALRIMGAAVAGCMVPRLAESAAQAESRIHSFAIDGRKTYLFLDANLRRERGVYPTFGTNQARAAVEDAFRAAGEPVDWYPNAFNILVHETADGWAVIDTGLGPASSASWLQPLLAEAGIKPDAIRHVFITHDHFGHVNGLIDGEGRAIYAKATVHLCEQEPVTGRELSTVQDRIARFAPSGEIIPGIRAVATPGHTPGHTCFLVGSDEKRILCLGDTAYHHVVSLQHPDWHFQFDLDPNTTVPSRRAVLDLAATEGHTVLGYHWPFPGLARVRKEGDAFSAILT